MAIGNGPWKWATKPTIVKQNEKTSTNFGVQPTTIISLSKVPYVSQTGYEFIYVSSTIPNKKLIDRAIHTRFVGIHSDERLWNEYTEANKKIITGRLTDSRPCKDEIISSISTLPDGLSIQSERELLEKIEDNSQEGMHLALLSEAVTTAFAAYRKRTFDPRLPRSFNKAIQFLRRRDAIDREYKALNDRGTCKYVNSTPKIIVLPFTCAFRCKSLDVQGTNFFQKAGCVVRGDFQDADITSDPYCLFAPVASHKSILILFAVPAAKDLTVERGDVNNAYIYRYINYEVFLEQMTDSIKRLEQAKKNVK